MREYIAWPEDFSVGVAINDEQHKNLLRVINEFLYSLEDVDNRGTIDRSLEEMIWYTDYHFYTEQLLLEVHPDFPEHLEQHWQLAKKSRQIRSDFQAHLIAPAEVFDLLVS